MAATEAILSTQESEWERCEWWWMESLGLPGGERGGVRVSGEGE